MKQIDSELTNKHIITGAVVGERLAVYRSEVNGGWIGIETDDRFGW